MNYGVLKAWKLAQNETRILLWTGRRQQRAAEEQHDPDAADDTPEVGYEGRWQPPAARPETEQRTGAQGRHDSLAATVHVLVATEFVNVPATSTQIDKAWAAARCVFAGKGQLPPPPM